MLIVSGLSKEYPSPAGPLAVLRDISLELKAGEAVAIMGPSGSGKSTLLHILGALDQPTSGTVTLEGQNPFSMDEAAQAHFRNRHLGFVFQDHFLLPQLTVLENVLVPLLAGEADHDAEERAKRLLTQMGLEPRLAHKPAELSGGEKQRTAIARALLRGPKLLLCDEPTGNLDRESAAIVASTLERARDQEGAALIVVTHSAELASRFGRRLQLRDGRLHEQD